MRIRRILSASLLIAALAAGTAACGSDGAGGDRMSDGASGSASGAK